jgi:hypothetical protein
MENYSIRSFNVSPKNEPKFDLFTLILIIITETNMTIKSTKR